MGCPNEIGRLADGWEVIRLDPAGFDCTTTNRDVYYQYKNGTQVVQLKDYVGDNGAIPNYYGVVTLLDNQVPTGYAVYNSIDDYLTARANETATSNHFVVRENGKLIYYVVHSSATEFTEGTTYDCVIGTSAAALSTQSDCGMVSSFTMEPQAKLVLNGAISDNVANTASICGNQLNALAIKLYGSNGSF